MRGGWGEREQVRVRERKIERGNVQGVEKDVNKDGMWTQEIKGDGQGDKNEK